jgi:protein TonB
MAVFITLWIFYIMQALVSQGQGDARVINVGKIVDFVRLKKESPLERRKRKLPQKQQKQDAPKPPEFNLAKSAKPGANALAIGSAAGQFDLDLGGGPNLGAFQGDSEAVPLVRVAPMYPERAAQRGIEGWVELGFTITVTGAVKDEFVIQAYPSSIFNRSAMKAVRKFKYKPKVVDGVTVDQPGQTIRLTFELDK